MNTDNSTTITVAFARSGMYQFLSVAFFYPEEELFSLIQEETFAENATGWVHRLFECGGNQSLRRFENLASSLESFSLEDLQVEYQRIFGHTISKEYPPYETEYGKAHIFQSSQDMADIAGFYRAFGLEPSEELKERLDHISIELEFMHFLIYKEAYALEYHGLENSQICREAQRNFLKEHLGRWAPFFVRLLSKKVGKGFYKELTALTEGFLAFETQFLEVTPEEIRHFTPAAFEPELACLSCNEIEFEER